jgi:hypothetical protein
VVATRNKGMTAFRTSVTGRKVPCGSRFNEACSCRLTTPLRHLRGSQTQPTLKMWRAAWCHTSVSQPACTGPRRRRFIAIQEHMSAIGYDSNLEVGVWLAIALDVPAMPQRSSSAELISVLPRKSPYA